MTTKKSILQKICEREADAFRDEILGRLGRKPLPEGEARFERTTIRWRSDELETIRRVAPDGSISDAIRALALEAAANRDANAR